MVASHGNLIDLGSPDSYGHEYFRYLRLKHDFTQKQIAKKLRMTFGRLGRIERGQEPITREIAFKIADFFGVDPERLYGSA